ncbi:MAG: phosphoribosyltransferase [Acidobacteria bacterium]|nr:phosphoribosyltransferase [Acidobacteriota bacterium]
MQPPVEIRHWSDRTRVVAWRWYFPERALPWASTNGKRFHEWMSNLKSGSDVALTLFANVIARLCEDGLLRPDAIAATPSSQKYEIQTKHSVAALSSMVAQMLTVGDLNDLVRRTRTVPRAVARPGMRDEEVQFSSMQVSGPMPPNVGTILLLDDVLTSGSTARAAVRRIREMSATVQIDVLALGKTNATGSTQFPDVPAFPDPSIQKIKTLQKRMPDLFRST